MRALSRSARAAWASAVWRSASPDSARSRAASARAASQNSACSKRLGLQCRQLGGQGLALLGQRTQALVGDGQLPAQALILRVQLGGESVVPASALARVGDSRPQRGDFLVVIFLPALALSQGGGRLLGPQLVRVELIDVPVPVVAIPQL